MVTQLGLKVKPLFTCATEDHGSLLSGSAVSAEHQPLVSIRGKSFRQGQMGWFGPNSENFSS